MRSIGQLFHKGAATKPTATADQSRARQMFGQAPGQDPEEQRAMRQHMEDELDAQRSARTDPAKPEA